MGCRLAIWVGIVTLGLTGCVRFSGSASDGTGPTADVGGHRWMDARVERNTDAASLLDSRDAGDAEDAEHATDASGAPDAEPSTCTVEGATQACATGHLGVCAAGQRVCMVAGASLNWGPCQASILPGTRAEAEPGVAGCANGEDDDCDGLTDEQDPDCQCAITADCPTGLACIDTLCLPCTSSRQCEPGQGCASGICGPCTNKSHCAADEDCQAGQCVCVPSNGGVEICDGLDNDCDGQADEDETRTENHPYQLQRCCNPPASYWCCSPAHGGSESGDIGDCCTYWEDNWVTVPFSCD